MFFPGQRNFSSVNGAHQQIIDDLMTHGSDILPEHVHGKSTEGQEDKMTTRELLGYSFLINSLENAEDILSSPVSTVNKEWSLQEFKDRIENSPNPGRAYLLETKWQKMLEGDGKFSYTYGERWAHQLPKIIQELRDHPNSRQAVLTTWESTIDLDRMGGRRVPCTMMSQFLIRRGQLEQIYFIRSNDAIWIMPSDVYQMAMIQKYIAEQVGVRNGSMLYTVGSLHVYKRDAGIIEEKLGIKWN